MIIIYKIKNITNKKIIIILTIQKILSIPVSPESQVQHSLDNKCTEIKHLRNFSYVGPCT